jgi:hypothetical protein
MLDLPANVHALEYPFKAEIQAATLLLSYIPQQNCSYEGE